MYTAAIDRKKYFCGAVKNKGDDTVNVEKCTFTKPSDMVGWILNVGLFRVSIANGQLYCSEHEDQENVYLSVTDNEAAIKIYSVLSPEIRSTIASATINEVIKRLRVRPEIQYDFSAVRDTDYIKIKNGVYSVDEQKISKQNIVDRQGEKVLFPYQYDFEYIENSSIEDAPIFCKFLDSVFDGEDRKAKAQKLLEIYGYCLSNYTKGKCAFFLLGPSNSGKSVLLGLLKSVVDERSYTTLELTKLGKRFNKILLADSRINICDEISGDEFNDVETFKTIVSGEMLTGEFKGKDPIQFRPQVKLLSAGNVLPRLKDNHGVDAIIYRMVVLKFTRSIPKEEQDIMLREKLEKEKNVIFSLALDCLKELKANNFAFTKDTDSQAVLDSYVQDNNVLRHFFGETFEINMNAAFDDVSWRLHTSDIWDKFCRFCEDNCIERRITKNELNHFLQSQGLKKMKFRKNEKNAWGYHGIRMKKSGTLEQMEHGQ